jgi:hypothetical protein
MPYTRLWITLGAVLVISFAVLGGHYERPGAVR